MCNKHNYLIFLGGGLGNQMFQYAAARAIQLENGGDLVLVTHFFDQDPDNRTYRLNKLNLPKEIRLSKPEEWNKIWFYYRLRKKILFNLMNKAENPEYCFKRGLYYVDPAYTFYDICTSIKNTNYIYGAFQTEKYFKKYTKQILSELTVNTQINQKNINMLKKIQSSNSVCLHIRRGDYIADRYSKLLNICSKDYYEQAVKIVINKFDDPCFFCFSNTSEDVEWIRKNYNLPENTIYVDLGNEDYDELRLMYSCKHFILSNSSFSWWAQELSDNCANKLVIAPDRWINNYEERMDIYKDQWILIKP